MNLRDEGLPFVVTNIQAGAIPLLEPVALLLCMSLRMGESRCADVPEDALKHLHDAQILHAMGR
jgi:hypothetical protein